MGPAVTFLRQRADTFAPGVPIVFCGADARDLAGATRIAWCLTGGTTSTGNTNAGADIRVAVFKKET